MVIEWTINKEIQLFHAMAGHKPVGINKHFQMIMIHSRLSTSLNEEVDSKEIWEKLETLYDLPAVDDIEKNAMPSHDADFSLPNGYIKSTDNLDEDDDDNQSTCSSDVKVSAVTRQSAGTPVSLNSSSDCTPGPKRENMRQQATPSQNTTPSRSSDAISKIKGSTKTDTPSRRSVSSNKLDDEPIIPRRLKRGRESKSGSPAPSHTQNKRRKT